MASIAVTQQLRLHGADLYTSSIKPLLAEKCIACHGPLKAEAGLRLDAAKLIRKGSENGAIVAVKDIDQSPILQRVGHSSPDQRMPPMDEGVPLNQEQLERLRKWLTDGMPAPEDEPIVQGPQQHWAYRPIVRPPVPVVDGQADSQSVIDRLIAAKQLARNIVPLERAEPATLLRRLTFDLTGYPPTPNEIAAFASDQTDESLARVADELMSRPEYGERWGRHWMDVWRYSDWDGYKLELRGSQRHIWHWRDWIIESLNANKPYDQMVREMIAGDEIAPTDRDVLRATGFLARSYHRSNRNIWLDATVEHTAKAFLGLTINCAKCHDHKFDPIGQEEYYQFRAIFEPHNVRTEQFAGEPDVMKAGLPRAFDAAPDAATYIYVRGNEKQPLKDKPITANVPKYLPIAFEVRSVPLPRESYRPDLTELVKQNALTEARKRVEKAQAELTSSSKTVESTQAESAAATRKLELARAALDSLEARYAADEMLSTESNTLAIEAAAKRAAELERSYNLLESEVVFQLAEQALGKATKSAEKDVIKRTAAINKANRDLDAARIAFDKAIDAFEADPTAYTHVGTEYPHESTGRRLALAKWITNKNNPLTARVAVNQIWMRHFDQPLVANVFDFGMRTPEPELCDLLDWLAAEFIESGWNMKHLHRLIVSSQTYQRASAQSSSRFSTNAANDPDNTTYWRANVRRLDAEQIRDSMLATSGALDRTRGGPDLAEEDGETSMRRSVYFRHAYEKQMTMMVLFDAASPNECYRRSPSIIPQQALVMSNSALARSLSRRLATALSNEISQSSPNLEKEFIERLFMLTLGRRPSDSEEDSCLAFLDTQARLLIDQSTLHAVTLGAKTTEEAAEAPVMRARQSLAHVLFNHNDFVNIR